jgi:hypothetical protein
MCQKGPPFEKVSSQDRSCWEGDKSPLDEEAFIAMPFYNPTNISTAQMAAFGEDSKNL